jgi:bifunctional non-homologous end joining protein LigD
MTRSQPSTRRADGTSAKGGVVKRSDRTSAKGGVVKRSDRTSAEGGVVKPKATVSGIPVSHADKMWWPDDGITKLDVVRYYAGIAPYIVPWRDERVLVAERCPDGATGDCFFQKNFEDGLPEGVPTATIAAESVGRTIHYVIGGSVRTLLAADFA